MSRFCLVGETRTQLANFTYSFRIQRCHCIFSLCTISEPLVNWTDLDNCKFPWQNRNSFLTRYCPGLSRRRCLSSLKTRRSWRHLTHWSYFFFTNISAILDPRIRPLRLNCLQSISSGNGAERMVKAETKQNRARREAMTTLWAATTRHCQKAKTFETRNTYHILTYKPKGMGGLEENSEKHAEWFDNRSRAVKCRRHCANFPATPYSLWRRLLVNNLVSRLT